MFTKKNENKKESYIDKKNIGKRMTNVEFGMNYLMSTMSDIKKDMRDIQQRVERLERNGINISIDLDN